MKFIMGLILFFASSMALACPNLVGAYKCQGQDGSDIQVRMSNRAGITTYTILDMSNNSTHEFIADGREHAFEDIGKYRAVCKGANLEYHAYGQFMDEGVVVGSMDIKTSIFLEGRNIRSKGQQTLVYGGQTQKEEINETCIRK